MDRYYLAPPRQYKSPTQENITVWELYDRKAASSTQPVAKIFDDLALANRITALLNDSVARNKK